MMKFLLSFLIAFGFLVQTSISAAAADEHADEHTDQHTDQHADEHADQHTDKPEHKHEHKHEHKSHEHHEHHSKHEAKQTTVKPTRSESIYEVLGDWQNPQGEKFKFSSLKGKIVVLTMMYTSCQYSCPLTIGKLLQIDKEFRKIGVKNFQFVLASFDVVRDTPQKLKSFMAEKKLPAEWTMLAPVTDARVRELSVLLGVNYKKEENNEFAHSNVIVLLDQEGNIKSILNGLNSDIKDFDQQALKLSHD